MISGSENAENKRNKTCSGGERDSRKSEGKLTSEPRDVTGHSLLLLNHLIVVKGKALLHELQICLDAAVFFKEGLEGGGPKVKGLLRTEIELLA